MPSTLTGVVFFIVLLLPGFAYLVGKERHGTERKTSPFRETVAIVSASVTSELAVLAIFVVVQGVWPALTPDVGQLLRNGREYFVTHYGLIFAWGAGLLLVATVLAYTATLEGIRRYTVKVTGPYPHPSAVSAWWVLFEHYKRGREVYVGVLLEDASYLHGKMLSFNQSADDGPDREMILGADITYRAPGATEVDTLDCGAVSIPARRILAITVAYVAA